MKESDRRSLEYQVGALVVAGATAAGSLLAQECATINDYRGEIEGDSVRYAEQRWSDKHKLVQEREDTSFAYLADETQELEKVEFATQGDTTEISNEGAIEKFQSRYNTLIHEVTGELEGDQK